jgi:hypothetical protein
LNAKVVALSSIVSFPPRPSTLFPNQLLSQNPKTKNEKSVDMSQPTAEEIRAASYVGFDSITRQIEKKLLKRGFQFNVIVVGQFSHLIMLI